MNDHKKFTQALLDRKRFSFELMRGETVLTSDEISQLGYPLSGPVTYISYIEKTSCDVQISAENDLHITPGNTSALFLAFLKLGKTNNLAVISELKISDVVDLEPYFESLQEFQFQSECAKIFNMNKLQAYESDTFLSEDEAMNSEYELLYAETDKYGLLVYPLNV